MKSRSTVTLMFAATAIAIGLLAPPRLAQAVTLNPGDLLIADRDAGLFHVAAGGGTPSLIANLAGNESGVVIAANGDIFVSVMGSSPGVYKLDTGTDTLTPFATSGFNGTLSSITEDPVSGDLIVGDQGNNIFRVNRTTMAVTTVVGVDEPNGIAHEAGDKFIFTDRDVPSGGGVYRLDLTANTKTLLSSSPANGAFMTQPHGVVVDGSGDIYVVNTFYGNTPYTGTIVKIDPTTGAQTLISSDSLFSNPIGLTFDNSGYFLVSDEGNDSIFRVDPVSGSQTLYATGGLARPWGMAVVPGAVPEPSSFALAALGLVGLGWFGLRRRKG